MSLAVFLYLSMVGALLLFTKKYLGIAVNSMHIFTLFTRNRLPKDEFFSFSLAVCFSYLLFYFPGMYHTIVSVPVYPT